MSLIAVSSIVRHTRPGQPSSFLTLIDLDTERVSARVSIPESPYRSEDPNPRGGIRGARGVSGTKDRFVVATGDRMYVLDPAWRLIKTLTHPWLGAIHDIHAEPDGIWATSTAANLVVKVDWDGNILSRWHPSEDPALLEALDRPRHPKFDDARDYRIPAPGIALYDTMHINGVVRNGHRLLVSLGLVLSQAHGRRQLARTSASRMAARLPLVRNRLARWRQGREGANNSKPLPAPEKHGSYAVVELELDDAGTPSGPGRVLWRQQGTVTPKHNPVLHGGLLLYNDSDAGALMGIEVETGSLRVSIPIPGSPSFARGLALRDDGTALVGSQRPAAIYTLDLDRAEVTGSIELGGEEWETVHAISSLDPAFSGDPSGFAEWATVDRSDASSQRQ